METGSVFFLFTTGVSTSNFQPHQSSRARIVTRPNWSVPVNGEIV